MPWIHPPLCSCMCSCIYPCIVHMPLYPPATDKVSEQFPHLSPELTAGAGTSSQVTSATNFQSADVCCCFYLCICLCVCVCICFCIVPRVDSWRWLTSGTNFQSADVASSCQPHPVILATGQGGGQIMIGQRWLFHTSQMPTISQCYWQLPKSTDNYPQGEGRSWSVRARSEMIISYFTYANY